MSLYNEDEISKAINSIKHEEESEGEELPMLSLGKNIENVATEETPAPIVQHNECECVWCKPHFANSINELNGAIIMQISDLEALKEAAKQKLLLPHPGETTETTSLEVNLARSVVDSSMAHFLVAASEGNINITNIAARNTSNSLRDFTQFIGCYVSTIISETDKQFEVIDMAKDVLKSSMRLINEAKNALTNQDHTSKERLSMAGIEVSLALNKAVQCIPGQHIEDERTVINDSNGKCPKASNI